MKRIFHIAAVAAAAFCLTSCDDLLEVLPLNYWMCGSETVLAKSAAIEYSTLAESELALITLSPKQTGLDEGVCYTVLTAKEALDKAFDGEEISASDLMISSYSATGVKNYYGTLGKYISGFGKFEGYTYEYVSGTLKAKVSSGNYLTLTIELKAKAVKKGDEELSSDDQFEVDLGCHFAGVATFTTND